MPCRNFRTASGKVSSKKDYVLVLEATPVVPELLDEWGSRMGSCQYDLRQSRPWNVYARPKSICAKKYSVSRFCKTSQHFHS